MRALRTDLPLICTVAASAAVGLIGSAVPAAAAPTIISGTQVPVVARIGVGAMPAALTVGAGSWVLSGSEAAHKGFSTGVDRSCGLARLRGSWIRPRFPLTGRGKHNGRGRTRFEPGPRRLLRRPHRRNASDMDSTARRDLRGPRWPTTATSPVPFAPWAARGPGIGRQARAGATPVRPPYPERHVRPEPRLGGVERARRVGDRRTAVVQHQSHPAHFDAVEPGRPAAGSGSSSTARTMRSLPFVGIDRACHFHQTFPQYLPTDKRFRPFAVLESNGVARLSSGGLGNRKTQS